MNTLAASIPECFSLKTANKARMLTRTTSVQYFIADTSQFNKARGRCQKFNDRKRSNTIYRAIITNV